MSSPVIIANGTQLDFPVRNEPPVSLHGGQRWGAWFPELGWPLSLAQEKS
jgi:hypothetical protein